MKIDYKHNLEAEEAYERISHLLLDMQEKYANKISDPEMTWNDQHTKMDYSVKVMGALVSGQAILKPGSISFDAKLPFMARMFSKKIEAMVREQLKDLFS
ncbi:hypothetical protein GOV14_03960 [Candidatus Pacearchaeota archaeon]|nr:hypothetical protein [Candidatus Pacearchaeota archaeon]